MGVVGNFGRDGWDSVFGIEKSLCFVGFFIGGVVIGLVNGWKFWGICVWGFCRYVLWGIGEICGLCFLGYGIGCWCGFWKVWWCCCRNCWWWLFGSRGFWRWLLIVVWDFFGVIDSWLFGCCCWFLVCGIIGLGSLVGVLVVGRICRRCWRGLLFGSVCVVSWWILLFFLVVLGWWLFFGCCLVLGYVCWGCVGVVLLVCCSLECFGWLFLRCWYWFFLWMWFRFLELVCFLG